MSRKIKIKDFIKINAHKDNIRYNRWFVKHAIYSIDDENWYYFNSRNIKEENYWNK